MVNDKTMNMNNINALIAQLCPDGAEFRDLGEVAEIGTGNNNRVDSTDDGLFPFYVRSKEIYKIKTFAFDEEAIIIPGEGGIGEIFHYINGKYGLHQRAYRIHLLINDISTKFIYYYMMSNFKKFILQKAVNATVSSIRKPMIEKFPIPIPPIAIQQEIVNILDKFTQLQAELQAELQARRAQYEYYRNELLNFEGKEVEWKTLGECIEKNMGGGTPSKAVANYWNGDIPWASVGDLSIQGNLISSTRNFITGEGLKNSSSNLVPKGSVIVAVKISPGKMKIADIDIAINQDLRGLSLKNFLNNKFLTYYFQTISIAGNGTIVQGITVDTLNRVKVPVPPINEQNKIASVLDKFDKLIHDITEGLPAEIQARRKQYEYYRGKLLYFKPLTTK